jgi:hypothetical protein
MPRFVILIHDHPVLHWDFLLEDGDRCRAWRLTLDPGESINQIPALELPDHRSLYLNYEGPVSGGRGTVTRWDFGAFNWQVNEPDLCEVLMTGNHWRGRVQMQRVDESTWTYVRFPSP